MALPRGCTHYTPLTAHNRTDVEADLVRTCRHDFQPYGDWQNVGFKFGAPKRSGYDNVCAHSGCSSGGGTLFEAGVRRVSDGHMFCEYSCGSAHAVLTAARRCTRTYNRDGVRGQNPMYSQVRWSENITCGYTYIQDQSRCINRFGDAKWPTSGEVKRKGLWARATCPGDHPVITEARVRFDHNGSWTGWITWAPPW